MTAALDDKMDSPLRRLRAARGISAKALADSLGYHPSSILRMEWGELKSTDLAEKISKYFGVDAVGRPTITEIELLYPERFPAA